MVPAHRRRFPGILAEQLSNALNATRPLGDQALVWLEIYRDNLRKSLAESGLHADFQGCGEGIPAEHLHSISLLHDAFEELHRFRSPGGQDRYISAAVYREAKKISVSEMGSVGANAKHDGPTGKRIAKEKIRKIWASGKYSSRTICAEQECAALDMSFDTARKALRNTPDPA